MRAFAIRAVAVLAVFLWVIGVSADSSVPRWVPEQYNVGSTGGGGGGGAGLGAWNIQNFMGGAGTYTWTKPADAHWVYVVLIGGGCGGGSGGYGASDSGGGGASSGGRVWQVFDASTLNATEDVVLGSGGLGGARKLGAGNGNAGTFGTETSFGAAARNLIRLVLPAACGGQGGDNASGVPGSASATSFTTAVGLQLSAAIGGGAGDDTAGGSTPSASTPTQMLAFIEVDASGGGGGGGTNGGANFTIGGDGGQQNNLSSRVLRIRVAGGAADGANGSNGAGGGYLLATANGYMQIYGGNGGSAGAGSVLTDGGNGGNGGNCGGGGGGGGSSLNGAVGSGKGGDGGAGCVWVISY